MGKVAALGRLLAVALLAASLGAAPAAAAPGADVDDAVQLAQARPQVRRTSYFETGWLGSGAGWQPEFAGFNELLKDHGFAPFDRPVLVSTGGGYISVGGWRVGGFGGEGEAATKKGANFAQVKASLGAGHIARTLRLGRRTSLDVGMFVGGGQATLVLSEGSPSTIEEAVKNRHDTVLDTSFMLAGPVVGLQHNLWGWLSLRLEAGHLYTLGWWKHSASGEKIAGGPGLSGPYVAITTGFTLQLPIFEFEPPSIERDDEGSVTVLY